MLQYILTGLAGIALGIVAMRVWQAREAQVPGEIGTESAGEASATPVGASSRGTRKLLFGAAALVVLAIGAFAMRSADEAPQGAPSGISGNAGSGGSAQNLDDVDTMISRLAQRLEKNPGDGEGFRMLGWSYAMTGHPEKAVGPYKRALQLLPKNATAHAGYGEALVGVAGNTVTPEAKAAFERAIAIDPAEPRARYFLALWQAQHGQEKEALEKWIALANGGPADAPWQADLRRQIGETSRKLGVDVSGRLKAAAPVSGPVSGPVAAPVTAIAEPPAIDPATMQSASQLPASDRQAMIDGMVEGLAARLKTNPKDADGWLRLLRSRMVLKQEARAREDLAIARKALAGDAEGLRKVNAAAAEFRVPGA